MGESDRLHARKRALLGPFKKRGRGSVAVASTTKKMGCAEKALKQRKEESQGRVEYPLLPVTPPMSDCVERLFFQKPNTLSSITEPGVANSPGNTAFVKEDCRFWTTTTVSEDVKRGAAQVSRSFVST
ncbi:hypothetical protein PR002_g25034 [Phytophthora rubi]|uniref:Uncharacterized protein n=1 Tax=Phytophthora rubi TaxID=129364 RepID=A0A6A3I974_9STRA|nr:hypothetical protein PR002_g25034 [Phytophthora rubi]